MKKIKNHNNNNNNNIGFFRRPPFTIHSKNTFNHRVQHSSFNKNYSLNNCHKISFKNIKIMLTNVMYQQCNFNFLHAMIVASNTARDTATIVNLIKTAQLKPTNSDEHKQLIKQAIKIWFNSDLNLYPGYASTNKSIKEHVDPNVYLTPQKQHYRVSPTSKDILDKASQFNKASKLNFVQNYSIFSLYSSDSKKICSSSFYTSIEINKFTPDSMKKINNL